MGAGGDDPASPGAAAPEPTLARGAALGRFVVLGLVGRGAMGEVYAAYDPDLDRKVAIKLVRADRSGDTADSRARLMREAQATAKVSHPNVVVVYDAGTLGDRVFIAMEFVEGHTLRYWREAEPRAWLEILDAFLAAGRGLAAAHEKGLVHRDFKPDNVMVGTGGHVRVMDFGLARRTADGGSPPVAPIAPVSDDTPPVRRPAITVDEEVDVDATGIIGAAGARSTQRLPSDPSMSALTQQITQTGTMMGTPAYMSPEQFRGQAADARSDQFSFCVALWEALYDNRPFAGRSLAELEDSVTAGRKTAIPRGSRVPGWVEKVLDRGLDPSAERRFPSMAALLAELDRRPSAGRAGFASGAAAKLAGVWPAPVADEAVEAPEKAAVREAFLATGKAYAESAFAGASAALDRYAAHWSELYVDVCEATHVRGEQSAELMDLRMACLLEGLDDLKALCRLFRAATGEVVENAVRAASSLGTLERCQDPGLIRAVVRPPEDAATRTAVSALRARLAEPRALRLVGRLAQGLDLVAPLVEETRRLAYGPALAEALLVQGELLTDADRVEAARSTLEEAVWAAELARHDEVAAEAITILAPVTAFNPARLEVAEVWCQHGEIILRRMGGHDQLWGWLFQGRVLLREAQGRLAEAIEDARLAIAAKERALGPDAPDVGISVMGLANALVGFGDHVRGLEVSERAVQILSAGFGPEHPMTAGCLSNHAEFLWRDGRLAEAGEFATRALAVLERETDPRGLWVSHTLLTLGLVHVGMGRSDEAVPLLERAVAIREALGCIQSRLADVHFALARALDGTGEHDRALALARRARAEYDHASKTPVVEKDAAELDRWLAARGARQD